MRRPLSLRPLVLALVAVVAAPAAATPEPSADDAGNVVARARKTRAMPQIDVIGTTDALREQPGSAAIIDQEELLRARTLTVPEALRKIPGVNVRDEEGFGLRPNIGLRGLNPTRSTKVLLLEDGIPAAYAPYGDNASYYHAPLDRYDRIEVLKGVGQLRFGPQSVGGVINYITPEPPEEFSGYGQLAFGNRDYVNLHASVGGGGALIDVMHREGDAARDNQRLEQRDFNAKYVLRAAADQGFTFRLNYLEEDSQVTYSGITDAEFERFGRFYNPFRNDTFEIERYGGSITHETPLGPATLTSNLYYYVFERDWWRQSSTTTDTQCGTAFRDARLRGDAVDVDRCNSAQGRLREYDSWGVESRLFLAHDAFGVAQELEVGLRYHDEQQDRLQVNAITPRGRSGTVVENNLRETDAVAGFIENRFRFGSVVVSPIVRIESIDYFRRNALTGRSGSEDLTEIMPGLGVNWAINPRLTLFAGVHEGFAPPRTEDIIDNNGGSVEVDAEESSNVELGLRGEIGPSSSFEAALFSVDFDNQIAVGSIAGGATPLAQGETLYRGGELKLDWEGAESSRGRPYAGVALTLLSTARQEAPLRSVVTGAVIGGSAEGLRLPYAPRRLATARIGWRSGPWDASAEVQASDEQFSDFANTRAPIGGGAGQVGVIPGYSTWSLTLNWLPEAGSWSAFATVKNAFDREYIVDRTRGILPGSPRQFVAGLRYAF
jgi:Fe(3+) dicitrate transport protein